MQSGIVVLFALTSFMGAFPLFAVQPMIGKMALPIFGGTPAVWNTSLVFFQGTLLAGYLWQYAGGSMAVEFAQRVGAVYLSVLAALLAPAYFMLPIVLELCTDRTLSPTDNPATVLLFSLLGSAAFPVLNGLVDSTPDAALVCSRLAIVGPDDPYFLLRNEQCREPASTVGLSIHNRAQLGIVRSKPALEVGISGSIAASCGRAVFRGLAGRIASEEIRRRNSLYWLGPSVRTPRDPAIWLRWLALVFVPSSWLLGVTAYLYDRYRFGPTGIWIIPLALYLLSFVLAFARSGPGRSSDSPPSSLPLRSCGSVLVISICFKFTFLLDSICT